MMKKLLQEKLKGFYLLKELVKDFQEKEITALGAQTTFYLIISFFPFLIFLITLISYTPLLSPHSLSTLSNFLPKETYDFIMGILTEVLESRSVTLLSFGMLTTLLTASNGIMALLRGINKAYEQKESRSFIRIRLLSIFFTIGLILLMVVVLVLLVLGKTLALYIMDFLGLSSYFLSIWNLIRYGSALFAMTLCFSALYYYGINGRVPFKEVLAGAVFATLGWVTISLGFSYYVNHFGNYAKMYGSIGGVFVLLLWLYLSSIILLLGAEINHILQKKAQRVS